MFLLLLFITFCFPNKSTRYQKLGMDSSSSLKKKIKLSVPIDDLVLHPNLIHRLKEAKLISLRSILHLSEAELQKIVKISDSEAKNILAVTSQALLENNCVSALTLFQEKSASSRMNFIPDILKSDYNCDGIYTGTITEICGESGSGKTQVCMHLSIHAQKPFEAGGLNCKVIYIHSEGDFPIKRYHQMADAFKKENLSLQHLKLSDNLILKKVYNLFEILHVLQKGIPDLLLKTKNAKVIIIDSVAALLRCEYESVSSRTPMLQQFAYEIWKLANLHGLAVICVNQVSGLTKSKQSAGSTSSDVPSLGLLWSNILTTRIKVSRKVSQAEIVIRMLQIIFSSYHPHIANDYIIGDTGVKILQL